MTSTIQTALLTTVNAPNQSYLDASALSAALKEGKIELGQVASFFTENNVKDQLAFAHPLIHPITPNLMDGKY